MFCGPFLGACIHETSTVLSGTETRIPLPTHASGIYAVQIDTDIQNLKGSQLVRL